MSLISVEKVSKSYDNFQILDQVSFSIEKTDRLGLIGKNGSGKTTLMEILVGRIFEYQGRVQSAKQLRIGYLSQDLGLNPDLTVHQEVLQVFNYQQQLDDQMLELMLELEDHPDNAQLLQKLAQTQDRHEQNGGYQYELSIKQALTGLGFSPADQRLKIKSLSGGQRNRVALAKILLQDPDLLLLDEPTNHLDIRATEWLENYLNKVFSGAVLMISHDRYFLDRVVRKVLELRNQQLKIYRGNYSAYLQTKNLEQLTQAREYKKQQQFIAREEEFIRRNIAGQKTKQAQGRRTRLERLERIQAPESADKSMQLQFKPQIRGGNEILHCRDVSKKFGLNQIFSGLNCDIHRGDVVGILGANGTGKTTFLRLIRGEHSPSTGVVRTGHNLNFGYFDQELGGLDENSSVIDVVWQIRSKWTESEVRNFLAAFLFVGDEVFKMVADLSGGERSRLLLSKLLLENPNVLLLDEPTNHLDIQAREALEAALMDYSATILMISHDRYFLSKLANKLLIFADAGVEFYSGTYAEYQRDQEESVAASSSSIFAVAQTMESPQREPTTTASTNPASTTPKRERLLVAKKRAKSR